MEANFIEVPATRFLVTVLHIPLSEVPHQSHPALMSAAEIAAAGGLTLAGPPMFFYQNFDASKDGPIDVEMGFPVSGELAPGVAIPATHRYREAEPFLCIDGDYIGDMPGISGGWDVIHRKLADLGYKPGPEQREIYKVWVDYDSPDNVTALQAEVLPLAAG